METAISISDFTFSNLKSSSSQGFRFTERDLDVLEFILEMKFSTLEDLHSKFFRVTKLGSTSHSLIWARQRLNHLVKTQMIRLVTDACHRPLYVANQKGYFYLRNSRPEKNYSRPSLTVDSRTLIHDQRVSQIRIHLENSGQINSWISEKQLSEMDEIKKHLSSEFRPDGIYKNSSDQKVAFELEIARKAKDRYHQKVRRYIQVMTEASGQGRIFDLVHFVCEKQNILELIRKETLLYQSLFIFSLESEIYK